MEITKEMQRHFLLLYCMVVSDGIVEPKEMETLYRIGRENYSLSEEDINKAIVQSGSTFIIPDNIEERFRLLYEMALIAWADGKIEDVERRTLRDYSLRFGVDEARVHEFVDYILNKASEGTNVNDVINELY